jgi:hypothetical protein
MDTAVDIILWLSQELDHKHVFVSCDKGNKKGVDHLVKYLSWLDDDGKVQVSILDIDGSEGTGEACAQAIEKSLKKLNLVGRRVVLKGQSTDSGGGCVLENLSRELVLRALTVDGDLDEGYLMSACTIRCCLQLQLARSMEKYIGPGGLSGERNAVQMCHNVYLLQSCMKSLQWKTLMEEAKVFHDLHYDTDLPTDDSVDLGDRAFNEKWNKVRRPMSCLYPHSLVVCWELMTTTWYSSSSPNWSSKPFLPTMPRTRLLLIFNPCLWIPTSTVMSAW